MIVDLKGEWFYIPDPKNMGLTENWQNKKEFSTLNKTLIPQCWNTIEEEGQLRYDAYEGVMWFSKTVNIDEIEDQKNYFLKFNGSNYFTKVWLNGEFIGENEGGFLPFQFMIDGHLKPGQNIIIVRVDNFLRKEGIPSTGIDWYNWGGLYRRVYLESKEKERIEMVKITTKLLSSKKARLQIHYSLTVPLKFSWEIHFEGNLVLNGSVSPKEKNDSFDVNIENAHLWSPENPNLYEIRCTLSKTGIMLTEIFGIREIEVRGSAIYLNKKRIKMRGINLHEEQMPMGRSMPEDLRRRDIQEMKKIGFNALRTAHYPHDESLMKIADEEGILILEEIPVYWGCEFGSKHFLKLAMRMIKTLIDRDFNHPSVILWSVGNEIPVEDTRCQSYIKQALKLVKKLDPTRIATYVSCRFFETTRQRTDVACLNQYWGWYYLKTCHLNVVLNLELQSCRNKPWLITEFGGGARHGFHSANHQRFSEEHQAAIITDSIRIMNSHDHISGWFIWIYRDFRSHLRTNKYQQGFNRKGIVSDLNKKKLIARILPKILNQTKKVRKFGILPFPFAFALKFVEKGVWALGQKVSKSRSEKMAKDWYSRKMT